ncbi:MULTISPECIES: 2-amino-4-hydroxy-6-hydroxymethyldihydropteridine diphosphokinase [Gammaproteobacteria]|uniref:2-amino-4-hydroxy-6- hydroxymethyldihydropteridine diphosphokinase n=1 Tax=Gammaproteobacteria TaxID=1236 RepID=UPI000DCFD0B3|nr:MULTISPECIES: 2-amino-4-hydroxy-6-hydroxymethyldihydropteridine diphosphokinase [Gammaproteobacteria]RTE85644.1 2-amino-4-hydroxy-6-hydroxymethyldihydropteridine diphosphokinase [Aliidiomarina sp. B3213]TCZ89613.1 2-amino-4-hydroxy-6-hydroxymethyldihydropteridine diphosphokinase [Lysobacter sp. N42]
MAEVFIGIGANLGDPVAQVESALKTLQSHQHIQELQSSSLYASKPMGPQDQPDYVNAVARLSTLLNPHALLDALQGIENDHHRVRKQRWGARTLDLDILYYDDLQCEDDRLTLPHPGVLEREFVLYPLAELSPNFLFPDGNSIENVLAKTPRNGLEKIKSVLLTSSS